jgi:hypothetical protein
VPVSITDDGSGYRLFFTTSKGSRQLIANGWQTKAIQSKLDLRKTYAYTLCIIQDSRFKRRAKQGKEYALWDSEVEGSILLMVRWHSDNPFDL